MICGALFIILLLSLSPLGDLLGLKRIITHFIVPYVLYTTERTLITINPILRMEVLALILTGLLGYSWYANTIQIETRIDKSPS